MQYQERLYSDYWHQPRGAYQQRSARQGHRSRHHRWSRSKRWDSHRRWPRRIYIGLAVGLSIHARTQEDIGHNHVHRAIMAQRGQGLIVARRFTYIAVRQIAFVVLDQTKIDSLITLIAIPIIGWRSWSSSGSTASPPGSLLEKWSSNGAPSAKLLAGR